MIYRFSDKYNIKQLLLKKNAVITNTTVTATIFMTVIHRPPNVS